jgi:GntR family transcriptional repressor for pyruvate dehydrogenase complex
MSSVPRIDLAEREALSQEIARKLIDHILSGEITPGSRMPSERQLAAELGVGRSAVREALKSLGLLGLIEVRPGDGTYLRRPDSELLPRVIEWGLLLGERRTLDLVEARQHLEVVVAQLAAEHRDDDDLKQLEKALERMKKPSKNPEAFVDADVEFHLAVAQAAKNGVLLDILRSIRSLLRVWVTRAIAEAGETESSYQEHLPVFEAIRDQRPAAAAKAMANHMEGAAARLRRSIAADGSDGDVG